MSNMCIAERQTDNRVVTDLKVYSDVVLILPERSHRPYLFPYSVDDRFLQYVLKNSFLCSVCECESTFQSLLKKKKERNIDRGRTLLHSRNPVMSTQQEDGDGEKKGETFNTIRGLMRMGEMYDFS